MVQLPLIITWKISINYYLAEMSSVNISNDCSSKDSKCTKHTGAAASTRIFMV